MAERRDLCGRRSGERSSERAGEHDHCHTWRDRAAPSAKPVETSDFRRSIGPFEPLRPCGHTLTGSQYDLPHRGATTRPRCPFHRPASTWTMKITHMIASTTEPRPNSAPRTLALLL